MRQDPYIGCLLFNPFHFMPRIDAFFVIPRLNPNRQDDTRSGSDPVIPFLFGTGHTGQCL
jgi:hypothetical protein